MGFIACIKFKDSAYCKLSVSVCVSVRLSVCLLDINTSCGKTAELIEMPFWSVDSGSQVGPWNHVLYVGALIPHGK